MIIKMRPFSLRERLILYAALAVFVCVLLFKFLISPAAVKLSLISQDIAKKTALLKRYSRLIGKGDRILSLYENYKENLKEGADPEEVVDMLFKEIESSAKSFNLSLDRIRPQPPEDKGEYKKVSLEIEGEGDFSSIFQFIDYLENSSSFVRIAAFRLFSQTASPQLRCRITLYNIFF